MDYRNEEGDLRFELVADTLIDATDGYLSMLENVDYTDGNGPSSRLLGPDEDNNNNIDEAGKQLLRSLSQMHSIVTDYTIKDKRHDAVLERLARAAKIASKRSDAYAERNREYADVYHSEIIALCQAVIEAEKET